MKKGTHHTEKSKQKNFEAHNGQISSLKGILQSEEHKRKNSIAHKGKPSGFKGKYHTPSAIKKMRLAHKGKQPRLGMHCSEETLEKMREACKGEKSYRWLGGISYLPYCSKFNKKLKEEIRNKYGRKCFLCDKTELENDGKRMCVHHIDYDKDQGCNGKTFELVPLCRSCHSKTNGKREEYKEQILDKLRGLNDCD